MVKCAVVIAARMETPSVRRVTFRMRDPERLEHRAGQYILLHTRPPDGNVVKRAYSIASPPEDPTRFSLCVKRIPGGPASTFVHTVAEGTEVSLTGPWGKFVVEEGDGDLTLIATGTGISPTGALLREALARGGARRVRLLWGLRQEEDCFAVPALEELRRRHSRFTYAIALSRPSAAWGGFRGRVTDLLRQDGAEGGAFFLAGNGAMIAEVEELLQARGVPASAIRKEVFFTPGQVRVGLGERQRREANRARPGTVVVGLGLHAGARVEELQEAIAVALEVAHLGFSDVRNIAVSAHRSDEPGLRALAERTGIPLECYLPAELEAAPQAKAGEGACEALARLSAGSGILLVPKQRFPNVTAAVARVARPGAEGAARQSA